MHRLTAIFLLFLAGCAAQPKSTVLPPSESNNQRCITIPGQGCKKVSAGNVGGTTLGNTNEDIEENRP